MQKEPYRQHDIRWKQRFDNYQRALGTLCEAVQLAAERPLTPLEQQGLIQSFEFTHELGWNVLKDYLEYQGITNLTGSRDATRKAFKLGLISEGETWMRMILDRNLSSHTYKEHTANSFVQRILTTHYPAFVALAEKFLPLSQQTE